MTYVGATPTTGDFKKLDSITTSSATTFNLRQGGVAVYPQSANHCLVVLNGVLQTAGSSFNIVNDTIVFASSLASSDVINQILVLGNVNDIGVPSDDTVSTAKLQSSAVTDAKIADVAASKLTGTIATARLGSGTASSSTFLAGNNTWQTAGEDNTPYWFATGDSAQTISNTTDTVLQYNTEALDSASGYNTSTYRYTVQSGGAGLWFIQAGGYFDSASSWGSGEQVQIQIRVNGSARMNEHVYYGGHSNHWIFRCGMDVLSVNDYVDVVVWQNSGGTINWYNNNVDNSVFAGFRVKSI